MTYLYFSYLLVTYSEQNLLTFRKFFQNENKTKKFHLGTLIKIKGWKSIVFMQILWHKNYNADAKTPEKVLQMISSNSLLILQFCNLHL